MRDLRRFAGHTYRRLAAPFGRRALDRMLRDGLPARLERPLAFLFTGERSPELLALETRIEARRAELAKRPEVYRRGPMRWLEVWPDAPDGSAISSKRLANQSSVPRRWGTFLHLCAGELAARAIVEMGACLGISGAYLASAASQPRFITIEGSPALAPIAEETLSLFSGDARVLRMSIESGIGRALALLGDERLTIDLAHVDGHHEELATQQYVHSLIPHLSRGALLVLDDISLHAGMRRAWRRLSELEGVCAAVNAGRFGLLVWEGGAAKPRQYDLARYTGVWRSREAAR